MPVSRLKTEVMKGDRLTLKVTFKTAAGTVVDPDTVTLTILEPDDTVTTKNIVDLTKVSTGIYEFVFKFDQLGITRWDYFGETSTGLGSSVRRAGRVTVERA